LPYKYVKRIFCKKSSATAINEVINVPLNECIAKDFEVEKNQIGEFANTENCR